MRWAIRLLGVVSLISYAAVADVSSAGTYYVARTGRDSNSGTAAAPFLTINYGVSKLHPGDTLLVRAGIYDESLIYAVPSGTSWSNKVRVAAYPGETVTMRPTSGNFVLAFAGASDNGASGEQQYIEFDGINVDARGGITNEAIKIEADPGRNAHHIRIQNLTVTGNPHPTLSQEHPGNANGILATGVRADAIGFNEFINLVLTGGPLVEPGNDFSHMFYIQSPDNLIENCTIYDGVGAGVQIFNGRSNGSSPDRMIIRNNIIRDFIASPQTRGRGILVAGGVGHQIYNNLIYNIALSSPGTGAIDVGSSENTLIANNSVYGNAVNGILVTASASGTVVRNNISYGNGAEDYVNRGLRTSEQSNLFGVNPLFVNPGRGNFQLQPGSPAVNTGTSVSVVVKDLSGTDRPQGGAYDIGAFEFSDTQSRPATPKELHVIQD